MITPKEMAVVWEGIQKKYNETRHLTPEDTVNSILESYKLENVLETFAAITRIKEGDGRIWHTNRDWMNTIPVSPECYDWRNSEYRRFNEFFRTDLDAIHTTHIDQMITELHKRTK